MKKILHVALTALLTLTMTLSVLLLPLSGADNAALDSYEGTLQYTPSADGSTVTISYEVNGETVTYTVPNNDNYLFGGYAATDDLGRSLFDSTEVGSYHTERAVGIFYWIWHGWSADHGLYDLQKILDDLGMEAAADLNRL